MSLARRRIGIVTGRFPNASQTFVLDHITSMLDLGYDVGIIASPADPGEPANPEISERHLLDRTIRYYPAGSLWTVVRDAGLTAARRPRTVRSTLRSLVRGDWGGPTTVSMTRALLHMGPSALYHAHFGNRGLVVAKALLSLGWRTPLVATFHGYDATKLIKAHGKDLYDALFDRGQLFLTVSNRLREQLLALGAPAERTVVHHLGVRADRIDFSDRPRRHEGPLRLLSVARLVEKKGIEFGIRAVARVKEAGLDVRYDVIGDGPLATDLHGLVHELGLEADVCLMGSQARPVVEAHMRVADLLLAPSVTADDGDEEGIPVVLMEAMASGLPVISTAHSGIPEIVHNGCTGLLVPERDIEGLVEHTIRLSEDPTLREALAASARRLVDAEFNAREQSARLSSHYDHLL